MRSRRPPGKPPYRVVILLDRLGRGGIAPSVVNSVTRYDRSQFDGAVCVSRPQPPTAHHQQLHEAGIELLTLDRRRVWNLTSWMPLLRLLRTADVLHAHGEVSNHWARLLGRLARVPVIVAHHHTRHRELMAISRGLERVLHRWTDLVLTVSEPDRSEALGNLRCATTGVRAIPNGIDVGSLDMADTRSEARRSLGVPEGALCIAMIGRLTPQKNHAGAFRAIATLDREFRDRLVVLVAGDGPLHGDLLERARELGIGSNVRLLGQSSEVSRILRASDLMLMPSHWECLPMALLEAMYLGCPVVATPVGGTAELLAEAGWPAASPDDPKQTAASIGEVLGMPRDALEARTRAAATLIQSHYTAEVAASRLQETYVDLLDRANRVTR